VILIAVSLVAALFIQASREPTRCDGNLYFLTWHCHVANFIAVIALVSIKTKEVGFEALWMEIIHPYSWQFMRGGDATAPAALCAIVLSSVVIQVAYLTRASRKRQQLVH
jgi:hypothetical protein